MLFYVFLLAAVGVGAAAGVGMELYVNDRGPYTCSGETLSDVHEFCINHRLTPTDCDSLKHAWRDKYNAKTANEPCHLYILPMNDGAFFKNIAIEWLVSLLPTSVCELTVLPSYTDRPEHMDAQRNISYFLPEQTSMRSIVFLMTSLHEFGKLFSEVVRSHMLQAHASRLEAEMTARGGGKVVLVVVNDEFKMFPLYLYDKFDMVLRLGDYDPRPCLGVSSVCDSAHWLPRGPSKTAFELLNNNETPSTLIDPLRPASKRRYLANFVGNIDLSVCITMVRKQGDEFLKSCYRAPLRPAVLQGLYDVQGLFKKDLLLHPTSGYGLDSEHGASSGLSQEAFMAALADSAFTLCIPGASPESTRIYEALEVGSIPLLQKPSVEGGLLFGDDCPLPFIDSFSSDTWREQVAQFLLQWQDAPDAALDTLQQRVMEWWKSYKHSVRLRLKTALLTMKSRANPTIVADRPFGLIDTNRLLKELHDMVAAKQPGFVSKARQTIKTFVQLCQGHLMVAQGGLSTNVCPGALTAAAYAAHNVNLKHEFFCLANASMSFDPFSISMQELIADTHWRNEEWAEWNKTKGFAAFLRRVHNHSWVYDRPPMLPKRMRAFQNGGAVLTALLLRLQLCLRDVEGKKPMLWYHGLIDDAEIIGMLQRHISSSPPPLYDLV
jgi:hypothetical protein